MSQNASTEKVFTVGDRRTAIADTLIDAAGNPINLAGSTVAFRMVSAADAVKVDSAPADIDDAPAGEVSYVWQEQDVDTAGIYFYWWIVTTNGKPEHFPGDGKKAKVRFERAF